MKANLGKSFSQLRKSEQDRILKQAEQDAFLDPKMAEIFGEGGFPYEFMQSLRDIGR